MGLDALAIARTIDNALAVTGWSENRPGDEPAPVSTQIDEGDDAVALVLRFADGSEYRVTVQRTEAPTTVGNAALQAQR